MDLKDAFVSELAQIVESDGHNSLMEKTL